jgi:DNA transposition AAA+ family ATPase
MTKLQEKMELKNAINDYCRINGISKNEFAVQMGISSATLNNIEYENFDAISERMWRKVASKVAVKPVSQLFETSDFASVFQLCEKARRNRLMVGLTADTGMGKTTAIEAYSQRKNVYYVVYDKTMKPKQFFVALLREMGIPFEGNINEMVNKIANELNSQESPLVIIDEAGKITHTMILYLHVLRDKTCKNCGIVLAGMPYFKNNLIKFANKEKEGYAEFLRRINLWHSLNGLTRDEIMHICETYGITGKEQLTEMKSKKRFGDLMNAILLEQIIND